jgi:uncharacterized membrane protein
MVKNKKLLSFFYILIAIGIVASVYLSIQHYKPLGDEPCDINDTFNCSIVNKSIYSEILGIPVATLGLFWFLTMGWLIWMASKSKRLFNRHYIEHAYHWSIAGVTSVFYFVWAEWMLGAICLYCTLVHIVLITFFITLFIVRKKYRMD